MQQGRISIYATRADFYLCNKGGFLFMQQGRISIHATKADLHPAIYINVTLTKPFPPA